MRLVYKLYSDNKHSLVTTDDRGENLQVLDGEQPRRGVKRLSAYIEINCDNDSQIKDQVRSALDEMKTRVK